MLDDTYIGDGIYAHVEGQEVILTTGDKFDGENKDQEIYLDDETGPKLVKFLRQVYGERN